MPVRPPAEQPWAAPADPEPSTQELAPAEETAPYAQDANPAAPPPEAAPGAQGAETAAPTGRALALTDHAAAPGTPLAQGVAPARALSASPGAAAAAAGGREGAKYRAHTNPSHTHTRPPKPYPPKAAFPEGRPRPVCPPAPVRTPPGVTLPQLQRHQDARRVIQDEGGGVQATRARSGGREATGGVPKDERRGQASAQAVRSEGEGGGKAPRPANAGDRAGKGQGHGKDTVAGGSTRGRTQGREQGAKAGGHGAHGA